MRTALDTNVLSAIWTNEPTAPTVLAQLALARQAGRLILCPAVYAESLAHPNASVPFFRYFLDKTGASLDLNLPESVWTEAGLRYASYAVRRRKSFGEPPRRILADFLIGAHALLRADRLMTLDPNIYARDFPDLKLYPLQPPG